MNQGQESLPKPFPKKWGKQLKDYHCKFDEDMPETIRRLTAEVTGLGGIKLSQGSVIQHRLLSDKRTREIYDQIKREKRNAAKKTTTSER